MSKKTIALSFDLEYWYCGTFLKKYLPSNVKSIPEIYPEVLDKILLLLKRYNAQATFFVLTSIVEKNPDLIKKIADLGHEIASHGNNHELISAMNPDDFKKDLIEAKQLIKKITGQNDIGFRAPNFSITPSSAWALKTLSDAEYKYDSSYHPYQIKKTGFIEKRPLIAYSNGKSRIIECPIATLNIAGLNIPVSGGFYFRLLSYTLFSWLLDKACQKNMPILYFHCMDLHSSKPNIKIPWAIRLIKYWGIKKSMKKFEKLIADYQCISINKLINASHEDIADQPSN
jgi:polysaccharide deacetylase family protein (PEP-CTERM system associated)